MTPFDRNDTFEKIGKKTLLKWRTVASTAKSGDAPSNVDHTLAENPFKSRYGDEWPRKRGGTTKL